MSNVVLSQFLGFVPFPRRFQKVETAAGMGTAVIFVITLSSAVAGVIYKFVLTPLNITYLQTIVFILVIAALVQFPVEMFLKKIYGVSLQRAGCIPAPDYHQLCGPGCGADQRPEELRDSGGDGQRLCNGAWLHDRHYHSGGNPREDGV